MSQLLNCTTLNLLLSLKGVFWGTFLIVKRVTVVPLPCTNHTWVLGCVSSLELIIGSVAAKHSMYAFGSQGFRSDTQDASLGVRLRLTGVHISNIERFSVS